MAPVLGQGGISILDIVVDEKAESPSLSEFVPEQPPLWQPKARDAIERALRAGVPSEALAVFGRWWEVETWLRLLIYLELRAAFGVGWPELLPDRATLYAERDDENAYMPSADAANLLAYLDAGKLFDLAGRDDVWPLVSYALPGRRRWDGRVEELRALRNRIAHLRRPHRDDLSRLEQVLRDLEPGARRALESFNRQFPVVDAAHPLHAPWVKGQHRDADRLIAHADRQYETSFDLYESRRPWASVDGQVTKGRLIHATWHMRDGAILEPRAFWSDASLDYHGVRELLVVVSHDSEAAVTVTFSGADDMVAIADAIGVCFDLVLRHRDRNPSVAQRRRWLLNAEGLDWRVRIGDALGLATEDQPFSIFEA